ncbi:unnamed protein product [Arabis nemorensis]|uniref:Uncharacterized protein n=1 Tax=Arabis nemorensis TaxID=586526 RepID=A0A565BRK3_9BRAS|nr:unnamed protein product [Arabis nemorensis]
MNLTKFVGQDEDVDFSGIQTENTCEYGSRHVGVIFFELWCPFGFVLERAIVLTELKNKAEPPEDWVRDYPIHVALLERLLSRIPLDPPSAKEFLERGYMPLKKKNSVRLEDFASCKRIETGLFSTSLHDIEIFIMYFLLKTHMEPTASNPSYLTGFFHPLASD